MVLDIIKNRWSPVSFSSVSVEDYKLMAILEAARYAPSSMNEQPWLFILIKRDEPAIFNDTIEMLDEGNKTWAKNAYALIISLARMRHKYRDKINNFAYHDTGMAVSNMLLQGTSMGICFHLMGGFSVEKVKDYFKIDDSIEPVSIIALGYPGDGSELPENIADRDKKRKPRKDISEYAFRNHLNNPAF